MCYLLFFFFFKQKSAYEMRISDWSSDVCSSDLLEHFAGFLRAAAGLAADEELLVLGQDRLGDFQKIGIRLHAVATAVHDRDVDGALGMTGGELGDEIGRASCRERVCQ